MAEKPKVVVSRKRESYEQEKMQRLIEYNFKELTSYAFDDVVSTEILKKIGFENPSSELVELGRNLLNLEILARYYIYYVLWNMIPFG